MVKHIFKLIWNEKKANAWLFAEYVLVFCILWFCTDLIYNMTKAYHSGIGYDITDTFSLQMGQKPETVVAGIYGEDYKFDRGEMADLFLDRVGRHPDVESVSVSNGSAPYNFTRNMSGWKLDGDSLDYNFNEYTVSSGFFDVFRIEAIHGRLFDWEDTAERNNVVLVPINSKGDFGSARAGFGFGGYNRDIPLDRYVTYNVCEVKELYNGYRDENSNRKYAVGSTQPLRRAYYYPYRSGFFQPLDKNDLELGWMEIAVRVKPGRSEGFGERFMKDMSEQLQIGPYYLADVQSFESLKKLSGDWQGISSTMKTVYSVTFFILVNVFLGIMGTFWFRTQSRRSEIGLRMAMGSTRKKVVTLFAGETLVLLFLATIVGTVICLNIDNEYISEVILESGFYRQEWGIGPEQDVLNYAFAFLFLAVVSLFAVWYPAKQAASTQPAEVLHEE